MVTIKEIRQLSIEQRLLMVEAIWDSIAEDTTSKDLRIPEEERDEILKRYDNFKKGNQQTYSWNEVLTYAKEP